MTRLLTLLLLALAATPALAKTKLKLATVAPKGSIFHTVMMELGEAWKSASGGEVELKLYPGGVAGDDKDVIRKVRLGTMSGGLLTVAGIASVDTAIHSLLLPMFYDSDAELEYVMGQLQPDLDRIYEEKGFVVLSYISGGWVRFFTVEQGCTPEALSAMKLFVFADSPVEKLWKDAGFNPVPLPITEISTALQTGLVTALPTTPQAALLMQWQKHVPHMCDSIWAPMVGGIIVGKEAWEKIDASQRPALKAAAVAAGQKLREEAKKSEASAIAAMKERGLTVVPMDDALKAAWKKRTEEAWPKIRGTFTPEALFDKAVALRDAYRKGAR
ncbi:MAG: TRAP transporter substrate-binding protein DctP [Myxococcales bacterium]|nr:TRAP transporter substrate-binding protein DctP [Myxococcales bacterium]